MMVQYYMTFASPLQLGTGRLAGMGDEAAFDVYTPMANSKTLTAAETLTALDIIHKSFANSLAIQNPQDQKPIKSLALLKMFQPPQSIKQSKNASQSKQTF